MSEQINAKFDLAKYTNVLDLSGHNLAEIPLTVFSFKALTVLYLRSNHIQTVPVCIGELRYLTTLDLGGNQLHHLPSTIGQLSELIRLNLTRNNIRVLPKEIGHLRNLNDLYLGDNKLESLPNTIGKLTNLKKIYLTNCCLRELPIEICNLAKLETLDLTGNQILNVPQSMPRNNAKDLLRHLFQPNLATVNCQNKEFQRNIHELLENQRLLENERNNLLLRIEALEIRNTCTICMVNDRNCVLLPCRHVVGCTNCCNSIMMSSSTMAMGHGNMHCPFCRSVIHTVMRIFIP